MTMTIDDCSQLNQFLIDNAGDRLICLEGIPQSGKSTLASAISIRPCRVVVRIDCFARQRGDESMFCELVDRRALNQFLRGAPSRSIVEGVLLRELVEADLLENAFFVYVKSLSVKSCPWWYGQSLESPPRVKGFLHDEVECYHRRVQPHEKADLIFERYE